jgi:hypothetical protein
MTRVTQSSRGFVVKDVPHIDIRWSLTSCLCACHFGTRGQCDDLVCRAMRAQEARKAKVAA